MKFTALDLSKIPGITLMTLRQLREKYLELTTIEGMPAHSMMDRFKDEQVKSIDNFVDSTTWSEGKDEIQGLLSTQMKAINALETQLTTAIQRGGERGVWVAIGRQAPDAHTEIIPRRYWAMLKLSIEPPRFSRRLFCLSHATIAISSVSA